MFRIWARNFLIYELITSILISILFIIWFNYFGGVFVVSKFLSGNRPALYGTLASIFGSLLGFVITATSVVLGFSGSDSLAVVRESAQYPTLWKTFSATIRALAGATLVALACLLFDRDTAPAHYFVMLLVFATTLSVVRVARCIWALEKIIVLVTKKPIHNIDQD